VVFAKLSEMGEAKLAHIKTRVSQLQTLRASILGQLQVSGSEAQNLDKVKQIDGNIKELQELFLKISNVKSQLESKAKDLAS
jgi:hypothetical protein